MPDFLNVLLIEDSIDAAALVKHALRDTARHLLQLEWVKDLRTGMDRLNAAPFDAILLDLNLPDSEGFDTFARVRRQAPASAIIVLTADEDESLALQSVRAGAEEYLVKKDVGAALLPRRIRYAVERNRANSTAKQAKARLGKIIPLIGTKGGCGTTTIVINLGYALNQQGASVIAVELGREPGFSGHIPVPSQKNWAALVDQTDILPANLESALARLSPGYGLLCSPDFEGTADGLAEVTAIAFVDACRRAAGYVLVDCPSLLQASTIAVLKESDFCIFLVERSRVGVRCAKQRVETLLANGIGPSKLRMLVVNKSSFMESVPLDTIRAELPFESPLVIPPGGDELSRKSVVLSPNEPPSDSLFADTIRQLASILVQWSNGAAPHSAASIPRTSY